MSNEPINKYSGWTLFLDRDGVINKKIKDYVKTIDELEILPGVPDALNGLSKIFKRIIVITNQRGIGLSIMSEDDLSIVHGRMLELIKDAEGRIDRIYYCPHDINENCKCRKPKIGMIMQAIFDYPDIDLSKSIIAGDSQSDMDTGINAGIYKVLISGTSSYITGYNLRYAALIDFYKDILAEKAILSPEGV